MMNTFILKEPHNYVPQVSIVPNANLFKWGIACFVSLLLFLHSGTLLRSIDSAAAVVDIGMLSFLPLALVILLVLTGITLWLQQRLWPVFRHFNKQQFSEKFKNLNAWQQIKIILLSYFALLCFMAAVLLALL